MATEKNKGVCAYCLYGINPHKKGKVPIHIEKRANRITVMLKGDENEKLRQKKIIDEQFGSAKIKCQELFQDYYDIQFQQNSSSFIDTVMDGLRAQNIITHHAYKPLGEETTLYNLTDKVMISFKAGAGQNSINGLLEKYKLKHLYTFNSKDYSIVAEVTNESGADTTTDATPAKGKNPAKIANMLEKESIVETAEVSLVYKLYHPLDKARPQNQTPPCKPGSGKNNNRSASTKSLVNGKNTTNTPDIPKDTFFTKQWSLASHDELGTNGVVVIRKEADVNAIQAWNILNGGGDKEIIIAVIDRSFDFNHPDLKNQLATDLETIKKNFVFLPSGEVVSDNSLALVNTHGTSCAGIAVAENNGKGIVGIAYGCKLLPVLLSGRGGEDLKIRCFEEVAKVAHVISFSQSPLPERNSGSTLSNRLDAITTSGGPGGKGCVICVSAGNYQVPINQTLAIAIDSFDENGNKKKLPKNTTIFDP